MKYLTWAILGALLPISVTADPASCPAIQGASKVLAAGSILLVGEIHGTEESPAFLAALACKALDQKMPVKIALELPREESKRIETFLASSGSKADREALLQSPFWQSSYQDGRRSQAKVKLLDGVRTWKRAGQPVEVVLLDRATPVPGKARDKWMAESLLEAARGFDPGVVLSLTGNIHSRISVGTRWDPDFEPMGLLVRQALPERSLLALNVTSEGGTAWICSSGTPESCAAKEIGSRPLAGEGLRIVLSDEALERGHHGQYGVGTLTASPPAISAP